MICSKRLLTASALLFCAAVFSAKNDISDLRGLALNNAKIPVYDSQKRIQMMTFVDNAVREGKIIVGKNTVLDIIKKGSNVDVIGDAWQIKYYSLKAGLGDVFSFWFPRNSYSEGVVITGKANIDQDNNRAFGTAPVFFRSPMIDLDGIGFDVNFKNRTIQVNNEVQLVLRTAASDPRKLTKESIKKTDYGFVRAFSDSLLIDIEHDQIMLIGSVKVIDRTSVLTCDRLTIFLDREEQAKKSDKKDKKIQTGVPLEGDKGVSRILADGNVVITNGEGSEAQRAVSDHLVYDVKLGIFSFYGDSENPRFEQKQDVVSGKNIIIYREEQQIRIIGDCSIKSRAETGALRHITSERGDIDFKINRGAFDGNVKVRDGKMVISGPRANLEMSNVPEKQGAKKNTTAKKQQDRMLPGSVTSSDMGGSRQLDKVEFPCGIRVQDFSSSKDKPLDLTSEIGVYNAKTKHIDFERNVRLLDSQMTLNAGKLRIKLDEKADPKSGSGNVDRIYCSGGVKIVGSGENAGTLTAKRGVFLYKKDQLIFNDNVHLVNKKSKLDCDQLDLFLSNSKKPGTTQTGIVGVGGSNKVLTKAVATGKRVEMTDPQGKVITKHLVMHFEEIPDGAKATPGMLQSGSSRVTWIACNGGVRLESYPSKGDVGASSGLLGKSSGKRTVLARRTETDLKRNVARLFDKVSLFDDGNRLDCEKMTLYADAPDKETKKVDDPDADPFELGTAEDGIPGKIMLNPDLELKRVFCEKNVVLSTIENTNTFRAGGDTGEYLSSTRKLVINSLRPRRTWLSGQGRRQWCDKIIYDMAKDSFYGVNPSETEVEELILPAEQKKKKKI